jgi:hypothetical protein
MTAEGDDQINGITESLQLDGLGPLIEAEHSGGTKFPELRTFIGAYNIYPEKLIEQVMASEYKNPESIILIVLEETKWEPQIYRPTGRVH